MFEVWAPDATYVEVETGGRKTPLGQDGTGWWRAPGGVHGEDYAFFVNGDGPFPDPRTRRQPYGVQGASRFYEHGRYTWGDHDWRGRDLRGAVIYELHVGTYTPEGTFHGVIGKLDHLVGLGIDFVELMPAPPTPGRRNWGYDGVDLYAVNEVYGGPDGLKDLVDACHRAGIGVILDVVYNHLGPSGNYLAKFGPYLHSHKGSYWGDAVNLDGPDSDEVRRYFIENALQWLSDYHVDGLRLDAVHALHDNRATHFLEELSAEVDALSTSLGRPLTLIAESDLNDPRMVTARESGGLGMQAAWDDDVHHALHAAVTGERHAYYCDFGSLAVLAKVLTDAYLHDGSYSTFRRRSHGRPARHVPGYRFVVAAQNHDQIGNRPEGDRMTADQLWLAAGLLLTSPFTPMLFMGEEWGASAPYFFFTDHFEPDLADGEAERRAREFEGFGYDWKAPDPQDEETFLRSKLDWHEVAEDGHVSLLGWYRDLIALRKSYPDLADPRLDRVKADFDEDDGWIVVTRGALRVAANLGDFSVSIRLSPGVVLLASDDNIGFEADKLHLPARSLAIVQAHR
jgi:maltooligosyltrehalose trehalohydrolase